MNGSPASFLVERPRLEALARTGARKRLLLIVAPPGWGKTTLLLQTFKGGGPVLWHSVAQGEVGVQPAAGSLLRSVARLSSLGERSPDPGSSPLDHALELSALMERFFPDGVHVVIDGVDRSADRAPLVECIQGLVDHGPPRLHLVVSSTTALDLRLSRLAKRREVARIGQADLAFTPEEVASALELRWGSEAAARLADEVFRMCAGWPAGMALLVMARPTPPDPCEPLLPGDSPREGDADPHRLIASLDPGTYRLLSFASLLPEFTPSLLAEMCGTPDSAPAIEDTLRHCPVAIPTQGDFLIVSPVVREILHESVAHEWPAAEVRDALLRAAEAFEHCGRWEAAVELVLSAGSPAVASDILDRVGIRRILRKDTAAHIAWAKAFAASPDMGFAVHFLCGRAAQLSADYPAAAAHYRAALDAGQPHVGLTERLQILPNLLHALTMTGSAEAEAVEREILALTPDSVETAGYCHLIKGTQLKNAGALREAEEELIKAIPVLRTAEQGDFLNSALNRLGETQTARAKYREALATLRAVSESPRRADLLDRMHNLQLLGRLHGLRGEFDTAIARAKAAQGLAQQGGFAFDRFLVFLDLTLVCTWAGRLEEAADWLDQASTLETQLPPSPAIRAALLHFGARLAWARGRHSEAFVRITALLADQPALYDQMWLGLDAAFITLRAGSCADAAKLARRVADRARRIDARHQLANALALRAASEARDDSQPALVEEARALIRAADLRFMPAADAALMAELGVGSVLVPFAAVAAPSPSPDVVGSPGPPSLEIRTLGTLELIRGGAPIEKQIWYQRGKARLLFQLLLSRDSLTSSIDEIIEFLWPDADGRRGRERLHTTVSDLRRTLKQGRVADLIHVRLEHGFYRLVTDEGVMIDHLAYGALISRARKLIREESRREAELLLLQAATLYRGDFLPDALYQRFSDPLRAALSESQSYCLCTLASLAPDCGEAIAWWRRAVSHDPYEEESYRGYVSLCIEAGRPREAKLALAQLEARLAELQIPMPEWATDAAERLARGGGPPLAGITEQQGGPHRAASA